MNTSLTIQQKTCFWRTVLPYGALHFMVMAISVPLIDLPVSVPDQRRSIITGAVVGTAVFFSTLLALSTLYTVASMNTHLRYFALGWYFSLPWLVINGAFAGFTAYSINGGN